jgi:hypothetical protein
MKNVYFSIAVNNRHDAEELQELIVDYLKSVSIAKKVRTHISLFEPIKTINLEAKRRNERVIDEAAKSFFEN